MNGLELRMDDDIVRGISALKANVIFSTTLENYVRFNANTINRLKETPGNISFQHLSHQEYSRIRALLESKVTSPSSDSSHPDALSALVIYLLEYSRAVNLEAVPTFEQYLSRIEVQH